MRHRKLVVAGAVFGLAMGSGGAALAAGTAKAPAKTTVKPVMSQTYKINRYVRVGMRWNKDVYHVRAGGTLRVTAGPKGGEPHTFTVVRKKDLPRTTKQIDNCLPKGICGKLAMAHGADPSSDGPPKFLFLDNGKAHKTAPDLDRPGDSVALGFGPKDRSINLKVTAKKGTTLYFMCLIHPWMQAKVVVG
jgi:hypothetical protein